MREVNMFWSTYKKGFGNFGDELGPFLIKNLSNLKINQVAFVYFDLRSFIYTIIGVFKSKHGLKGLINFINSFSKKNVLITVGSVLSSYNKKTIQIWGSGIINEMAVVNPAEFFAVRGKYSQKRLKELGYIVPKAIGDPALLLPLIVKPEKKIKHELGIVPHYIHYDQIKENMGFTDVLIINLLDDIETVVKGITSCRNIISTSLHGLIVAQAYGIPSIWVKLLDKNLVGDNVKFKDYFSSVDIPEYGPFDIELGDFDEKRIITLITDNKNKNSIQNNLQSIQQSLIDSAPFEILPKYKK